MEKIDRSFVQAQLSTITDEDVKNVVSRADEIKGIFKQSGPLSRFIDDVYLFMEIIQNYWNGTYQDIPYLSVGAMVFALLYTLNPFDLIPDVIPFVGQIDDATVVAVCLMMVEQDLHQYRQWKQQSQEKEDVAA